MSPNKLKLGSWHRTRKGCCRNVEHQLVKAHHDMHATG